MPEITPKAPLSQRISQGRGQTPADLVLKGGRVLDLITGELVESDVAICGDLARCAHDIYFMSIFE